MNSRDYKVLLGTSFSIASQSDELKVIWKQVTKQVTTSSWQAIYAKTDEEYDKIVADKAGVALVVVVPALVLGTVPICKVTLRCAKIIDDSHTKLWVRNPESANDTYNCENWVSRRASLNYDILNDWREFSNAYNAQEYMNSRYVR